MKITGQTALIVLAVVLVPLVAIALAFSEVRRAPPAPATLAPSMLSQPLAQTQGRCPRCGFYLDPQSGRCLRCRWSAAQQDALQVALPVAAAAPLPLPERERALRPTPVPAPAPLVERERVPAPTVAAAPVAEAQRVPPPAATIVPGPPSTVAPQNWSPPPSEGGVLPGAPLPAAMRNALPSPVEQQAAKKEFIEGHWLGLETIPLTPELATEYLIPDGESGVLVDEITLESAESGILAGDMVHSIEGYLTPDLREFFNATLRVRFQREARVEVGRRGKTLVFTMRAQNAPELGIAQMEAAQPIQPGAISPHRSRGRACTKCHIIMDTGGQLPTDAGDILPNPPPIRAGMTPPHRYRGPCNSCHPIINGP